MYISPVHTYTITGTKSLEIPAVVAPHHQRYFVGVDHALDASSNTLNTVSRLGRSFG